MCKLCGEHQTVVKHNICPTGSNTFMTPLMFVQMLVNTRKCSKCTAHVACHYTALDPWCMHHISSTNLFSSRLFIHIKKHQRNLILWEHVGFLKISGLHYQHLHVSDQHHNPRVKLLVSTEMKMVTGKHGSKRMIREWCWNG